MKPSQPAYHLAICPESPRGLSPYRLRDHQGEDVATVNDFLDAQATRGLSQRSLRIYGYSLLHFWRWLGSVETEFCQLSERQLFLDYVRFQRTSEVEPAAATINHRLTAVSCLYRFHFGCDLPGQGTPASHPYHASVASPSGYLYPARRRPRRWRLRSPRRLVMPLKRCEVRTFLESFSTWRDLAISALMLLCGLRSREVIELELGALDLDEPQVRVLGKGGKERVVPLPGEAIHFLRNYLGHERPARAAETVFVSLKGEARGRPMTPAGLRSLFRHHRLSTGIQRANPHRLRHTFASDLASVGISVPALMVLMGHADINTTMRYVELSPRDVYEEFQRVLKLRASLSDDHAQDQT